jgi:hypothetical protein
MSVITFTTVGTDILQIIFTTAYSSIFQYAIYGFVFYTVSVGNTASRTNKNCKRRTDPATFSNNAPD